MVDGLRSKLSYAFDKTFDNFMPTGDTICTVTANDGDYTAANNAVTYSLLPAGACISFNWAYL